MVLHTSKGKARPSTKDEGFISSYFSTPSTTYHVSLLHCNFLNMLIVVCYKYLILHVHIVQFDFHVRHIPFRGDRSPHTALPHLVEPPSACSDWAPGPPCHVRGEGEGPPPHKSQATSQPPIIGNPLRSKFRFYHPYTLTPQNDCLDVAIMACILIFVIYGRFK